MLMMGAGSYGGRLVVNINITTNQNEINILNEVSSELGFTPTDPLTVNVNVSAGVVVGANSTANYAMVATGLPAGSDLRLNLGSGSYVAGAGGSGGGHGSGSGTNGGPALIVDLPTVINGGTIGGGGGGGGGGRRPQRTYMRGTLYYIDGSSCSSGTTYPTIYGNGGGGGGGAGSSGGLGGSGNTGGAGSISGGGSGGATSGVPAIPPPVDDFAYYRCQEIMPPETSRSMNLSATNSFTSTVGGSNGGAGGNLGQAGSNATSGSGGQPGTAVNGYNNVTLTGGAQVLGPTIG